MATVRRKLMRALERKLLRERTVSSCYCRDPSMQENPPYIDS